jgi:hypothetical protein
MRALGVVVALLVLAALAGCTGAGLGDSLVDDWSIGEGHACASDDARCLAMVEVATKALAGRDAGHAPILQATLHEEGLYPNRDGELGQVFRSGGPPAVVLFQLADGTHRAIGVKYVLNDDIPTAYEYGPGRRPGRGGGGAPAPTI